MAARRVPTANGGRTVLGYGVRVAAVVGLGIDSYVHADLATRYDPISASISQGTLFRIESGASALAALLILLTARRAAYAYGFLVAASALGAILLYRYVNVGVLGPLPDMYEPIWFAEKLLAFAAEILALVGCLLAVFQRRAPATAAGP